MVPLCDGRPPISADAVQGVGPLGAVADPALVGVAVVGVAVVEVEQTVSSASAASARAFAVSGPSSPSTSRPDAAWKFRTASSVLGPITPSTVPG
jgi:hypothetical protein